MGYSTDFYNKFEFNRVLTKQEKNYINTFSGTRRMKRNVDTLMELYKGKHGYPFPKDNTPEEIYGNDGEYFCMDDGDCSQRDDKSIVDYNTPPGNIKTEEWLDDISVNERRLQRGLCQPSLWCQWVVTEDGTSLEWDGGEKFYNYIEWLRYMIKHFFSKWNVVLNGEVEWRGEEHDDMGKIVIKNNEIKILKIKYEEV